MDDHYFSEDIEVDDEALERAKPVRVRLGAYEVTLWVGRGVFAKSGLDRGSELLIKSLVIAPGERVLDLGCGYGPIAVAAALDTGAGLVLGTDVNPLAVTLAARSAESLQLAPTAFALTHGYECLREGSFDVIATNPPIRAGWRVVFPMIDGAPAMLRPGGRLLAVARTRQGADTLMRRIGAAFGNVEIVRRGSGFKVFRAVKAG
jgi:16S rRNA (guanine1207-N2)-methyltransferase